MKKRYFFGLITILLTIGLALAGCDPQPVPPTENLSGTVTIDNTSPRVGDTITAAFSGNGTGAAAWRWYRGNSAISGAASSSYTVIAADVGNVLRAEVRYADQVGSVEASTAHVAEASGLPSLTGTVALSKSRAAPGDVLTATFTGNGSGTASWQWYRDDEAIAGETARTYTVAEADIGSHLSAEVSYSGQGGNVKSNDVTVGPFTPVSDITGVPGTVTAGASNTLTATVLPAAATNTAITWSVVSPSTGVSVSGNTLTVNTATTGGIVLRATIPNGLAQTGTPEAADFSKQFAIAISGFVPVTSISGVPTGAAIGTPLPLAGTVNPPNATNRTIAWSGTGVIGNAASGYTFTSSTQGTFTLTATIVNGSAPDRNYVQSVPITVGNLVPVTDIVKDNTPALGTAGNPIPAWAGIPLNLDTGMEVLPATATYRNITWAVVRDGNGAGARISGTNVLTTNTFTAGAPRSVTVLATIANGTAQGTNYTEEFILTVRPFVAVTDIDNFQINGAIAPVHPVGVSALAPLALTAVLQPAGASMLAADIVWTVQSAGTTGAVIPTGSNVLTATSTGSVTVLATIANGRGAGQQFTKSFTFTTTAAGFVPVNDITFGPAVRPVYANNTYPFVAQFLDMNNTRVGGIQTYDARIPIRLEGVPTAAAGTPTNTAIVWSIKNDGNTADATLSGNILTPNVAGAVTVVATIANGKALAGTPLDRDFVKELTLTISAHKPLAAMTAATPGIAPPAPAALADSLFPNGRVGATNLPGSGVLRFASSSVGFEASPSSRHIVYSVISMSPSTGWANIDADGLTLHASQAGTVRLRATVMFGGQSGAHFTHDFDILISD